MNNKIRVHGNQVIVHNNKVVVGCGAEPDCCTTLDSKCSFDLANGRCTGHAYVLAIVSWAATGTGVCEGTEKARVMLEFDFSIKFNPDFCGTTWAVQVILGEYGFEVQPDVTWATVSNLTAKQSNDGGASWTNLTRYFGAEEGTVIGANLWFQYDGDKWNILTEVASLGGWVSENPNEFSTHFGANADGLWKAVPVVTGDCTGFAGIAYSHCVRTSFPNSIGDYADFLWSSTLVMNATGNGGCS